MNTKTESPTESADKILLYCSATMFFTLIITFPLWLSTRVYPLTPLFRSELIAATYSYDLILLVTALCCLIACNLKELRVTAITLFLFVSLVWWVQDQSRIVLWYYSILLLFVGLLYTFTAEDEKKAYGLDCCRIIVCGIYLWGGLNKLNPWFFVEIFPWFMKPFFGAATESPLFSVLAFGAAFTEGAIGVMLLFPRTRRLAVVLLTLLHLTILFCLGPLGHSRAIAVWPWNILMMIVSFLLFWNEKDRSAKEILTPLFPLKWCISFLVFIAPALWYVGYWNTHMSFHMYTGLRDNAVYQISNEQRVHLPYTVQEVLKENGELYPADWSMNEFAFTPHQEERVFFQIGRTLCYHTQSAGAVRMTVIKRPRVPLTWSKNGELTENLTHYLPCVSVQKKANG